MKKHEQKQKRGGGGVLFVWHVLVGLRCWVCCRQRTALCTARRRNSGGTGHSTSACLPRHSSCSPCIAPPWWSCPLSRRNSPWRLIAGPFYPPARQRKVDPEQKRMFSLERTQGRDVFPPERRGYRWDGKRQVQMDAKCASMWLQRENPLLWDPGGCGGAARRVFALTGWHSRGRKTGGNSEKWQSSWLARQSRRGVVKHQRSCWCWNRWRSVCALWESGQLGTQDSMILDQGSFARERVSLGWCSQFPKNYKNIFSQSSHPAVDK